MVRSLIKNDFGFPSLEGHIGNVVTLTLIPVPGFKIEKLEGDSYILHPYGDKFTAEKLTHYLNANKCDLEGQITLHPMYLREVHEDYIVVSPRGEDSRKIMRDVIGIITIGGVLVHEG